MTTTQNRAWKTSDPEIIDWAENLRARRNEAMARAQAYFDEKWQGRTGRIWTWAGGFSVTGMDVLQDPDSRYYSSKDYSDPPLGWRYDKKSKMLVPAKKTDEGKAIQQELDELAHSTGRPATVPRDLHSESVNGEGWMYAVIPDVFIVDIEGTWTDTENDLTHDSDYTVKEAWIEFDRGLDKRSIEVLADLKVWEPALLSAYWRASEHHDKIKAEVMAGIDAT